MFDFRGPRRWLSALLLLPGILVTPECPAANPGSEVVVVYNSKMSESKRLAEYYAQKRGVPASQVLGFNLPEKEQMTRREFEDNLQKPLAAALTKRKLWKIDSIPVPATTNEPARVDKRPSESKIRYAVLCYGVPLKILKEPNYHEEGLDKLRPEFRRDEAAVDNELALLPIVEQKTRLAGPMKNWVFGNTNLSVLHPTNGILMVARLDGPSPEIARALVDKALVAERDGLWGRGYFDLRGIADVNYKQGDDWIRAAAEVWRLLGYETIVDTNSPTLGPDFPLSQVAFYCGWYTTQADGPFERDKVEFMPGAFAYHLHSFSAATLRSTHQNWVGPLLAKGATITMGSVDEPYLGGTPDLGVFAARLVFSGFTFGEAAYASQSALSWQTTVVGDPLYRPFGRDADSLHRSLDAAKNPLIDWSYLRLVNLNLISGRPASVCASLLENFDRLKSSAVLTEKMAELNVAQGKPSSAVFEFQRALERDPSPMQRLRIRLALAEKLDQLNQPAEALKQMDAVAQEFAEFPKLTLLKKSLPLAQKAGDSDRVQRLQEQIAKLEQPASPTAAATNQPKAKP